VAEVGDGVDQGAPAGIDGRGLQHPLKRLDPSSLEFLRQVGETADHQTGVTPTLQGNLHQITNPHRQVAGIGVGEHPALPTGL
jgi:hypothetical protein